MMRILYLLFLVLLDLPNCNAKDAASSYSISTGSLSSACSASYIKPQSVSAGCGSASGTCKVGDEVTLYSKVKLSGLQSSTVIVNAAAKIYTYTYQIYKDYEVDICETAISLSGSTCPDDGLYEITALEFPLSQEITYLVGKSITAQMTFSDTSGTTLGCTKTSVKLSKSGYTSTAYAFLVMLPIAGLTVASSIYRRYKVKTQSLDLDGNVETVGTNFVGIA